MRWTTERPTRTGAAWLSILVLGCALPADPGEETGRAVVAVCSPAGAGPAWTAPLPPEATGDIEAEVQAADVDALPSVLDTSGLGDLELATLAYALEIPQADVSEELNRSQIDGIGPDLGRGVLASFAQGAEPTLDFEFLRRVLHHSYACDRGLPPSRDAFIAELGDYRDFSSRIVAQSVLKGVARTLYEDADRGIYVAETTDAETGELETDIILEGLRSDGALEFLSYGAEGESIDRVGMVQGGGITVVPAPLTCGMCHRDLFENTFTRVDPS